MNINTKLRLEPLWDVLSSALDDYRTVWPSALMHEEALRLWVRMCEIFAPDTFKMIVLSGIEEYILANVASSVSKNA
jgi:hypothetical protein